MQSADRESGKLKRKAKLRQHEQRTESGKWKRVQITD